MFLTILFSWLVVGVPLAKVLYRMLPLIVLFSILFAYLAILLVFKSTPKSYRRKYQALMKVENEFEENAQSVITQHLGMDAWLELNDKRYETSIERIKSVQLDEEQKQSLQYHVYVKAATACMHNSEYSKALSFLNMAIKIFPDEFIPKYRSALNHEFMGNREAAIQYYKESGKDLHVDSSGLEKLVNDEYERVIKEGPKKAGDAQGLKPIF